MEGGLEAMAALGWQQVQEEGEEVLTLAKGAATMAQVRRWGWCKHMLHRARIGCAVEGNREPGQGAGRSPPGILARIGSLPSVLLSAGCAALAQLPLPCQR